MTGEEFIACALDNPLNAAILDRLPELERRGARDCWLVAGCLYQAVWNLRPADGSVPRPAGADVKDYDIFYHDPSDLSWEAEDRVIGCADDLFADLVAAHGIAVEVRNQARVHLWYPARFGTEYPALADSRDGIRRFLIQATCVGLRPRPCGGTPELYAPYGLDDLAAGILRPNPLMPNPSRYCEKAAGCRRRWPFLLDS